MGKPMHEWLRFSVCYWHTFRGMGLDMFGGPTIKRYGYNHAYTCIQSTHTYTHTHMPI